MIFVWIFQDCISFYFMCFLSSFLFCIVFLLRIRTGLASYYAKNVYSPLDQFPSLWSTLSGPRLVAGALRRIADNLRRILESRRKGRGRPLHQRPSTAMKSAKRALHESKTGRNEIYGVSEADQEAVARFLRADFDGMFTRKQVLDEGH